MKYVIAATLLIAGCSPLGSLQPETVNAIASAGGGCVMVKSLVMGDGVIIIASADKGVIRNGEVTVAGACGGITIRETRVQPVQPAVPAVKP